MPPRIISLIVLTPGKLIVYNDRAYIGDVSGVPMEVVTMNHELNIGTINGLSVEQILDMMVAKGIGMGSGGAIVPEIPGFNPGEAEVGTTIFSLAGITWRVVHITDTAAYAIATEIISKVSYGQVDTYIESNLRTECAHIELQLSESEKAALLKDESTQNDYVFVPSYAQMNGGFSYFTSDSRRIAYYNDEQQGYWLSTRSTYSAYSVGMNGTISDHIAGLDLTSMCGFRPCVAVNLTAFS